MGLRIKDRQERLLRERMAAKRNQLQREAAKTFSDLKGGDHEQLTIEFLDKLERVRGAAAGIDWAQELAHAVEERVRGQQESGMSFQGPLEPSVIMELL